MSSSRQTLFSFAPGKEYSLKGKYPSLFYIEKKDEYNKRSFYILGTYHSLPLTVFSEAVLKILMNQSGIWTEHLFLTEAIQDDFEFFKIDEFKDKYLVNWWAYLEDGIREKLMNVFEGLDPNVYPQIHPKFYFSKIIITIFNYGKNGKMDKDLCSYYKDINKPISCLETYREVSDQLSEIIQYGIETINKHFCETGVPSCFFNFNVNNANDWCILFNFFLQENCYQSYFNAYQEFSAEQRHDFKYMNEKPEFSAEPSDSASDARSKNWYEKHFDIINDCLVICGFNHVLKGPNCLLKRLSDDGYDIYLVDNEGNKKLFNVKMQETELTMNKRKLLMFDKLNEDMIHEIFSFLTPADLGKVSNVCKFFYNQANSNHVWHPKFKERFSCNPPNEHKSVKNYYQEFSAKLKQETVLTLGCILFAELERWCRRNYLFKKENFDSNNPINHEIVDIVNETMDQIRSGNLFPISAQSKQLLKLIEAVNRFESTQSEALTSKEGIQEYKKCLRKIKKVSDMIITLRDKPIQPEINNIGPPPWSEIHVGKEYDLILRTIASLCKSGAISSLNIILHKYPKFINTPLDLTDSHASLEGVSFLDCAITFLQYDVVKLLISFGADVNMCQNSEKLTMSPLLIAIRSFKETDKCPYLKGESIEKMNQIIQLLLDNGADPDFLCGNLYGENPALLSPRQLCTLIYEQVDERSRVVLKNVIDWQTITQERSSQAMLFRPF